MRALFIETAIWKDEGKPSVSGGDVRFIEIAKYWQKFGIEVHVMTTEAGIELCEKLGLNAVFHPIKVRDDYSKISYIVRAIKSFAIPSDIKHFKGIIYSATDLLIDVIPGAIIKKNNPNNVFVVVSHFVPPLVRKGTSIINSIMFYANHRIGIMEAKKYADLIFAVSEPTARDLVRIGMPSHKIKTVEAGVHYEKTRELATQVKEKEYDGIFMKRLDKTKGVIDAIFAWEYVVKSIPQAKLILVGHGTKQTYEELKRIIVKKNLINNVIIAGPIYEFSQKIITLAKSKVFLLPSYEENWAIVIGEALATGIPVIAYELPEIKPIWKDSVIWVRKGDIKSLANKVVELLENPNLRNEIANKGIEYVKKYDWKIIAEKELKMVLAHVKSSNK